MSSSCSMLAPLVNDIINPSVPLRLTHQADAASIHLHHAFLSGRHIAKLCPDFVVNWIDVMAVRRPSLCAVQFSPFLENSAMYHSL